MNIRNIRYIAYCAAVAVLFSACKKDWLSPAQQGVVIKEDSTFKLPANAEGFVNAAYNQMLSWEATSFAFVGVTSITSDDADKGSSPGDKGTDKDVLDELTYTPTTASFDGYWKGLFQGVSRCNQALANVPKYNIESGLKNRLLGEARFLRAYYYFNLVRMWGGVPLVDTVLDGNKPEDFAKGNTRVSKEKIYDFIESDLNYAMSVLPTKQQYDAKDMGRATKGAAAAMLAKVSMYQQKWDKVLSLTDGLIAGTYGAYALAADYPTIFREVGENNSESLFEIQGKGTLPYAGVQQYSQVQGIRAGVFNVPSSQVYTGWGFNTPSADLDAAYEPGDVRRMATIMHRGDTLFDGVVIVNCENPRYNYKAYISRLRETNGTNSNFTNKNVRILRMGEVYLMNAEAANELGQTGKAQSALNAVRNRAKLANTTAASQADLRQAIWKERRVEMAMEHDRFFDLVRQGRAGTVLRAHGKAFVDGKHEVFPIPQTQIDASNNQLTQNPNY